MENVNLISGEFAPLVLYDPVIQGTAQGGLMVMGGVALGAVVPAGVGAAYTGLGLRASYAALRTAPMAFGEAAARVLLDFSGQYGANLILRKGPIGSFSEINLLETGMAGLGMNP